MKQKTINGKSNKKKEIWSELKQLKWTNFIGLTIAGIVNAIGVTLLLAPVGLLDGGLSGTAILLDKLTPSYLSLSFFLIILNFPFYIFGRKKIGLNFVIYSLFTIVIYSLIALLLNHVFTTSVNSGISPIAQEDILLCALFGGLLSGFGSGLTIRCGGALDGVEVMAVIFCKYLGLSVGTFVMLYNVILYMISAMIFHSWEVPLYSIIAYFVGIKTVDFLVDGLDKAKAVMIITDQYDKVCVALSKEFNRGVTIIDAKGYYSDSNKYLIYCVVNRFEISKLKRVIAANDTKAFVTINDTSDTMGNQFKLMFKKGK